jgi:hypothetical protein
VLAHPPVDIGRRNAGPDSLGDERERLSGCATGRSHAFDFGLAEDLDHVLARMRPAAARVQDRLDLARGTLQQTSENPLAWLT